MRVSTVLGAVFVFCLSSAIGAGSAQAQGQATPDRRIAEADNPRLWINRVVIGHALSMAIESSEMTTTAQAGLYTRGYGPVPGSSTRGPSGPGGGSYPGGASISGGANSAGTETRAAASSAAGGGSTTGGTSSAGSTQGSTGGPGGSGTNAGSGTGNPAGTGRSTGLAGREAYVSGNRTPMPRPRNNPNANTPPGQEDYGVVGVTGSPGMIGYASNELREHARRGFEESYRLFDEAARHAGGGNSLTSRYLAAAQKYARALESFAGWRIGTPAGAPPTTTSTLAPGAPWPLAANSIDPQTLFLVNHAVKEALAACEVKAICRSMEPNAEGTQILRQHARDMRADSERLIQTLASTTDVPGTRVSGASTGAGAAAAAASDEARSDPRLLNAATPPAPVRSGTLPVAPDPGTETSPRTQAAAGIPTEGIVAAQEGAPAVGARGSAPVSVTSIVQTARELIHTIGEVSGE
jgi:hypothetical protein